MMDIGALELSIAEFLESKINNPKVEVNPLPENEAGFEKVFQKEVIIVAFSDEVPAMDQKGLGIVYQETEVTFAFLIQSKNLRSSADKLGIYALLQLVKQYILGYEPIPGQPFRYAGMKMQEKANDVFHYAVFFKTKYFANQYTDNENSEIVNLSAVNYY